VTSTRSPERLPAFFEELSGWATELGVATETVRYGPHPDQIADLRVAGRSRGTVLVLHGGFWRAAFTRSTTEALASALALQGWTTANVEYRRLGPGTYAEMLDDVVAAAKELDAAVAIGHSAGGHLALWLGARTPLRAAIALGGVCDLTAAASAGLGGDAVRELLGGGPEDEPLAYERADPARLLPLGVAQVLVHGSDDDRVPIANARAYADRARAAGDDCRLVELEGVDHFDVIDPRHDAFAAVAAALPR
jgi:acetyl esterase/lipase